MADSAPSTTGRPRFHPPGVAEQLLYKMVTFHGDDNYETWWVQDSLYCGVCSEQVFALLDGKSEWEHRVSAHEDGCPIPDIISWHKDWFGAAGGGAPWTFGL